jgi:hypothetical protein
MFVEPNSFSADLFGLEGSKKKLLAYRLAIASATCKIQMALCKSRARQLRVFQPPMRIEILQSDNCVTLCMRLNPYDGTGSSPDWQ